MRRLLVAAVCAVGAAALFAGCGGIGGGPRKVVVNESLCGNVGFLNLELGKTNRVVLDNENHSDNQISLALELTDFPVLVVGDVPEGSTIGDPFSTVKLSATPGEEKSVDLKPTFTGSYTGLCSVTVRSEGGLQVQQFNLGFRLIDN